MHKVIFMELNKEFWIDPASKETISYEKFFMDLRASGVIITNYRGGDKYSLLLHFFRALVRGIDFEFVDADFSDSELIRLKGKPHKDNEVVVDEVTFDGFDAFRDLVFSSKSKIVIFTSGTTGLPKSVSHRSSTLLRHVKIDREIGRNVWGLAYNPTHIAGIHVLLQAVMNGCLLVDLYKVSRESIIDLINGSEVTHLSATPTFYRLLLPLFSPLTTVQSVALGGEKSDATLIDKLKVAFPNASIRNIYALTEAGSLFASRGDFFSISEDSKEKIKINNGTIHLHRELLGESSNSSPDEWYDTGDLIEWIDEGRGLFRIIARKSDLINVGGYKVNPLEVENEIRQLGGVVDVLIYGKPNSILGNLLCADIVLSKMNLLAENQVREALKEKLQSFKIPRKIYFVTELRKSRAGKTLRAQDEK